MFSFPEGILGAGDSCWIAELLAAEMVSSMICVRSSSSTTGSSTSRLLSRDLASSILRADTAVLLALGERRGLWSGRGYSVPTGDRAVRNLFAGFGDGSGRGSGASTDLSDVSASSSDGRSASSSAAVSVAESQAGLSSRTESSCTGAPEASLFMPLPLPRTKRVIRSWLGRTSTSGRPLRFFAWIRVCSFSFLRSRSMRALFDARRFSSSSLISLCCSLSY